MKLGIAYNIFNGDELLVDSLKRLRGVSDYIVLTYQNISNVGNKSLLDLKSKLIQIDNSLYDDIVLFEPSFSLKPQKNETNKRNLGLSYARKNKCTHFMSIDCDEFYDIDQFENAKRVIIENNYKSTSCELVNYYHSSKYQIVAHKQYVPFIFKITIFKKHKFAKPFPVYVDPTRVISDNNFYCFKSKELIMHHMSYVRKDYESIKNKLDNSPNKNLYTDVLDEYLQYYDDWNPKLPGLNPHQFKNKDNWKTNFIKIIDNPIKLSVSYKKNEY